MVAFHSSLFTLLRVGLPYFPCSWPLLSRFSVYLFNVWVLRSRSLATLPLVLIIHSYLPLLVWPFRLSYLVCLPFPLPWSLATMRSSFPFFARASSALFSPSSMGVFFLSFSCLLPWAPPLVPSGSAVSSYFLRLLHRPAAFALF